MDTDFVQWVERSPLWRRVFRGALERYYREKDFERDNGFIERLRRRNFAPEAVLIQISRRCNLRCTMCGWSVWQRNSGFMSEELYLKILADMKDNNIRQVHLTNPQGEPLLHPRALEFIKTALDQGFEVHLNTNCTTLGTKAVDGLVELAAQNRLWIQASFSGFDKEGHEKVYVGSKFDLTAAKLRALNDGLKARDLERFLTVSGVIYDPHNLPKHVKYLENLGFARSQISITLPDNFAGIVPVGKKSWRKQMFSFKHDLSYRSLRLCNLLALFILIYDDGKVSACACRDSENIMAIGDLTKQSLAEIRNGKRYQEMLTSFMTRNLDNMPLCKTYDIPYGDYDNDKLMINGKLTKPGAWIMPAS